MTAWTLTIQSRRFPVLIRPRRIMQANLRAKRAVRKLLLRATDVALPEYARYKHLAVTTYPGGQPHATRP